MRVCGTHAEQAGRHALMELHEGQSEHFKLRVRYKMALTEKVLLTPVRSITMTACGQHVLSLCV